MESLSGLLVSEVSVTDATPCSAPGPGRHHGGRSQLLSSWWGRGAEGGREATGKMCPSRAAPTDPPCLPTPPVPTATPRRSTGTRMS